MFLNVLGLIVTYMLFYNDINKYTNKINQNSHSLNNSVKFLKCQLNKTKQFYKIKTSNYHLHR